MAHAQDVALFSIPLEFRIKGGKALGIVGLSGIAQPIRAGAFGKIFRLMHFDKACVALFDGGRELLVFFEILLGLGVDFPKFDIAAQWMILDACCQGLQLSNVVFLRGLPGSQNVFIAFEFFAEVRGKKVARKRCGRNERVVGLGNRFNNKALLRDDWSGRIGRNLSGFGCSSCAWRQRGCGQSFARDNDGDARIDLEGFHRLGLFCHDRFGRGFGCGRRNGSGRCQRLPGNRDGGFSNAVGRFGDGCFANAPDRLRRDGGRFCNDGRRLNFGWVDRLGNGFTHGLRRGCRTARRFGLSGSFDFLRQLAAVKLRFDAFNAAFFDLRGNFLFGELPLTNGG